MFKRFSESLVLWLIVIAQPLQAIAQPAGQQPPQQWAWPGPWAAWGGGWWWQFWWICPLIMLVMVLVMIFFCFGRGRGMH
jgi:hypothetical protein